MIYGEQISYCIGMFPIFLVALIYQYLTLNNPALTENKVSGCNYN